jgi:hypothetical protein
MSRSPFPGMDPYLEAPGLWPDVHNRLATIFAEQLAPLLAPKYIADLHTQVVIDRVWDTPAAHQGVVPDMAVTQPVPETSGPLAASTMSPPPLRLRIPVPMPVRLVSVYIRSREHETLVTVIEILSPVNKRPGRGRQEYLDKRAALLESSVHLVEIDLLRQWPRMPLEDPLPACDYLAVVSDASERPVCEVWPLGLRQPLPVLPIPLVAPDPRVPLDVNQALHTAYARARYDLRVDYSRPPSPPLSPEQAAWAAALLDEEAL